MKKISLILIFCFLFQGCVTITFGVMGYGTGNMVSKNKNCKFEEVLSQKREDKAWDYSFKFGLVGFLIDIELAAKYYLRVHPPIGYGLLFFSAYPISAFSIISILWEKREYYAKREVYFLGWNYSHTSDCKEDYFILAYNKEYDFKVVEIGISKFILNYPPDYNISQDENFTNFQKDFLTNNKIQTYSKGNYFYYYIHYPGGKAKFEEDFGKYMFKK